MKVFKRCLVCYGTGWIPGTETSTKRPCPFPPCHRGTIVEEVPEEQR